MSMIKTTLTLLLVFSPALTSEAKALDISRAQESIVVIEPDVGQGSGVLLESNGVLVTNLHVIEDASDFSVRIHTGERFEDIGVIDVDEVKDLAILKVKGYDLPSALLGNSNDVKSGQDVFAIGAPRGLEQTVSRGIVSAVRVLESGFKSIQTDAAISPGSSGGGLFNEASELIAILAAFRGDGQNLNFAIPVNYVRGMMGQSVRYSEAEFVEMTWQTPSFGKPATEISSLEKLKRWTQKLSVDGDIEIASADDNAFIAMVGEVGVLLRLFDDLLWIVMPLGDAFEEEIELTKEQLAAWLKLSNEINYAYLSLDENVPSVAYEMSVSGSSYEAFYLGFYAVLNGAIKVIDLGKVSARQTGRLRKSPIAKNIETSGLRYVEPGQLGVEVGYRAFLWNSEATDGGFVFNTSRGVSKWVSVFAESIEFAVDTEEGLESLMSRYVDGLDGSSLLSLGFREIQGFPGVWAQYTAPVQELEFYYYSTSVMFHDRLVTVHTWSLEPEWELMDQRLEEFLSNLRYPGNERF